MTVLGLALFLVGGVVALWMFGYLSSYRTEGSSRWYWNSLLRESLTPDGQRRVTWVRPVIFLCLVLQLVGLYILVW